MNKDGYLVYSKEINEINEKYIYRQGVLDAGILKGKIVVHEDLQSDLVETLLTEGKNNPEYITKDDWQDLKQKFKDEYVDNTIHEIIFRSYEYKRGC